MTNPPFVGPDLAVRILEATDEAIRLASERLRAGHLVAFPTETVYGLGADATNDDAVASIFKAKGRPPENPLIVHIPGVQEAAKLARFDDRAERVAAAFWPGPLTLILERTPDCPISSQASAGLSTLAIRAPDHAIAQSILQGTARPLAAPSANPSGRLSPTTAQHVADGLGHAVSTILDGGPCRIGVESTVLALNGAVPTILRPGAVTRDALVKVLGTPVDILAEKTDGHPVRSPGMLASHYAPRAILRLEADTVTSEEGLLSLGNVEPPGAAITRNLSNSGNLAEAAGAFYACLREIDKTGVPVIAVVPIPGHGIGAAINDRLRRAAAPRA